MKSKVAHSNGEKCVNSPRSLSQDFAPTGTSTAPDDLQTPHWKPLSALTGEEENAFNKMLIPLSPNLISVAKEELFVKLNKDIENSSFSDFKLYKANVDSDRRWDIQTIANNIIKNRQTRMGNEWRKCCGKPPVTVAHASTGTDELSQPAYKPITNESATQTHPAAIVKDLIRAGTPSSYKDPTPLGSLIDQIKDLTAKVTRLEEAIANQACLGVRTVSAVAKKTLHDLVTMRCPDTGDFVKHIEGHDNRVRRYDANATTKLRR